MTLLLLGAVACWLGVCLIAVGLCVAARRGDAELARTVVPSPPGGFDAGRRSGPTHITRSA